MNSMVIMQNIIKLSKKELINELWINDPKIYSILLHSQSTKEARGRVFDYLNSLESAYFDVYSDKNFKTLHILEKNNAKECIRVLRNVIRTSNEKVTEFSALKCLRKLAQNENDNISHISKGFLCEFIYLFKGINGKSEILEDIHDMFDLGRDNRSTAINRSRQLDKYSAFMLN